VTLSYEGTDSQGESYTGTITITVSPASVSSRFDDMGSYSWAVPAVDYLYASGVISGTSDTQFSPERSIRRCDFVLMLCNAFQFQSSGTDSFTDVVSTSYYAQAVATAKALGITSGYADGRFLPAQALSRQDAMVMIYQAMKAAGMTLPSGQYDLSSFADSSQVADYAKTAVSALVQLGVVGGNNANQLTPRASIKRAEVAVILYNILTL
jgi:hypothetical protein